MIGIGYCPKCGTQIMQFVEGFPDEPLGNYRSIKFQYEDNTNVSCCFCLECYDTFGVEIHDGIDFVTEQFFTEAQLGAYIREVYKGDRNLEIYVAQFLRPVRGIVRKEGPMKRFRRGEDTVWR